MVNISEPGVMFWGLTLEDEKRYNQQVKSSFHISMAALEPSQKPTDDNRVSVLLQHGGSEYLLCTLSNKGPLQQPLDLNFIEDEELTIFHTGKGRVHLTGYLAPDDMMLPDEDEGDSEVEEVSSDDDDLIMVDSDEDSEEESDDEDIPTLKALNYGSDDESEEEPKVSNKRKKKQEPASKKARLMLDEEAEEDDEDESDLDDADIDQLMKSFEDDDEDDDEEESEEEESFITKPTKRKATDKGTTPKDKKKQETNKTPKSASKAEGKKSAQTPKEASQKKDKKDKKSEKKLNASVQGTPVSSDAAETPTSSEKKKKKKKKKGKKEENGETPKAQQGDKSAANMPVSAKKKKKQVLEGGLIVEDLKEGHGPTATPGKMMGMYYVGKLHNNQKEFDRSMGGAPFKFKLGKGEVIKGWDVGVKGMKVGGKRRLTVPPKMGYGSQRQGPIPPNSTLVFDVELKNIS